MSPRGAGILHASSLSPQGSSSGAPVPKISMMPPQANIGRTGNMKRLLLATLVALLCPATAQAAHRHHTHHRTHHHVSRHVARAPRVAAPAPVQAVKAPEGAFPVYGNDTIGDCGFAAATTWEWMVANHPTSEGQLPQLLSEFHEAGGTDTGGITVEELTAYWSHHGISGMKVSLTAEPASQLEPLVQAHTALLAVVQLHAGETIGAKPIAATEGHFLLVDGYNSTGPEVTTWGETSQLTWSQWTGMQAELYLPEVI